MLGLIPSAAKAQQSATVLSVSYAETESAQDLAENLTEVLSEQGALAVRTAPDLQAALRARGGELRGIDLQVFTDLLDVGEAAFYEMHFEESLDHLSSVAVQDAAGAYLDMAAEPELAEAVRRALLARARTAWALYGEAAAEEGIRQSLRLFPTYIASTDLYSPNFVAYYEQVRATFLEETHPIRVNAPLPNCSALINGVRVDEVDMHQFPAHDGSYAVQIDCRGLVSDIHEVDMTGRSSVTIDPAFDRAFGSDRNELEMPYASPSDFALLERMAVAHADISGVGQVWFAAEVDDGDWGRSAQIVLVDIGNERVRGARARSVQGGYAVSEAVEAILTSEPSESVKLDLDGTWPAASDGESTPQSQTNVGAWVLIGVGGAGLITGSVFAGLEASTFSDFEACRDATDCSGTQELADLKDDGNQQELVSLISLGVGASAAIAGVLWLVLGESEPEAPAEGASATRARLQLSPTSVGLDWRF